MDSIYYEELGKRRKLKLILLNFRSLGNCKLVKDQSTLNELQTFRQGCF